VKDVRSGRPRWLFLILPLLFAGGCSLGPVNTPAFSPTSTVRRIDPNHASFTFRRVQRIDPNTGLPQTVRLVRWKPAGLHFKDAEAQPFAVKYDPFQFWLTSRVLVPIELSGGLRRMAIVDTGFSGHLYMNDAMVESCDLAVLPMDTNPATGSAVGLCDVPSLKLGSLTVSNPPCIYEQMQWQFKVLGLPIYRHRIILLGLEFMRLFAYERFDNARSEIVISPHEAFSPEDASNWVRMPFALERIDGNMRMMVDLPIGENKIRVEFDTGGAKPGLILKQSAWQRIAPFLDARSDGTGRCASYQYGSFPCRKYRVHRLSAGPVDIRNAAVDILSDDVPLMKDVDGILSLDYFRDTSVVLDFETTQLWFRRPK
jgi:hypothetical protein